MTQEGRFWKEPTTTRKREHLSEEEARALICELCFLFYQQGWVSGTGGGISIRSGETIYMAPSGVQKERIRPSDIFVLDSEGQIRKAPEDPTLKVSACHPIFLGIYRLRGAGAILHSHSMSAMLATLLYPTHFTISRQEMLKGIQGIGAFDQHDVPIIPNTPHEAELTNSLMEAIKAYPKAQAVLVRGHGVYVWGKDWIQAKTQAECYDYLFEAAVRIKQLGLDPIRGGQ